ncbi:MAG TPA: hypothetical protein VF823_07810 [Anaerolineales bacterium]
MKIFVRLLALSCMGLFMTACAVTAQLSGETTARASTQILFQDDFSDKAGGWTTLKSDNKMIAYDQGGLRFFMNDKQFDYWSRPGLRFSDVHIEVDAAKRGGPDDNDYGIICRYQDENNFYSFLISSDGYYGISKMKNGEHSLIGADGMQVSDLINKGDNTNRVAVDCVGDALRLSVNGKKLFEVKDSDFSSGDVGLIAGTADQPGVDIVFDNFIVTKP